MKATVFVTLLVLVRIGWYVLSCWRWPLGRCLCCSGAGRHARKDGKVFRNCRWCKGTGRRWRIGRRMWNFFHRHTHS